MKESKRFLEVLINLATHQCNFLVHYLSSWFHIEADCRLWLLAVDIVKRQQQAEKYKLAHTNSEPVWHFN